MKNVLVTGSNGQLGSEIKDLSEEYPELQFTFTGSKQLDITQKEDVLRFFKDHSFDFCINCAAYTAVDKAEEEKELCDRINVTGSENLALACKESGTTLIQVSTDFVFDGNACKPLKEELDTHPVNYYGTSKRNGEKVIQQITDKYFILRTSWLYSTHGGNFVKTMLRLSESKEELNIIADQVGSPTYAKDLAEGILTIINQDSTDYGIYHFSNEGVASWYDFTCAIFEYKNIGIRVFPIPTEKYPTPAKRPHYSVMDKTKFRDTFKVNLPHWRESLKKCLEAL